MNKVLLPLTKKKYFTNIMNTQVLLIFKNALKEAYWISSNCDFFCLFYAQSF